MFAAAATGAGRAASGTCETGCTALTTGLGARFGHSTVRITRPAASAAIAAQRRSGAPARVKCAEQPSLHLGRRFPFAIVLRQRSQCLKNLIFFNVVFSHDMLLTVFTASFCPSMARPRLSRDRTVPTGHSNAAAASS